MQRINLVPNEDNIIGDNGSLFTPIGQKSILTQSKQIVGADGRILSNINNVGKKESIFDDISDDKDDEIEHVEGEVVDTDDTRVYNSSEHAVGKNSAFINNAENSDEEPKRESIIGNVNGSIHDSIFDDSKRVQKCKITQITPLTILDTNDNSISLVHLATDQNGTAFLLYRKFIKDEESGEDQSFLYNLDFYNGNQKPSTIISNRVLCDNLPSYLCSFDIKYDGDFTEDNPDLYFEAQSIWDENERINIHMNPEVFSSIAYIDEYIFDGINNNHDLYEAINAGFKNSVDTRVELFKVEGIESITNIAPIPGQKGYYTVCFKVYRYTRKDTKEFAFILVPLYLDKIYPKDKFKGKTTEKILEKYLKDQNQYLNIYMISLIHLFGTVDQDFQVFKAKNKNEKTNLFLLPMDVSEDLIRKIDEF